MTTQNMKLAEWLWRGGSLGVLVVLGMCGGRWRGGGSNMIIDLASLWNFLFLYFSLQSGVIVANLGSSDLSLCSALPLISLFL